MPKLVDRTPKYRHRKATAQAVVTLSGRAYYLGKWRSSESKRENARLTPQRLAAGGVLANSSRRRAEHLGAAGGVLASRQGYYVDRGTPTTELANYRTLIRSFRRAYGDTLVCDFAPLKLKAFPWSTGEWHVGISTIM